MKTKQIKLEIISQTQRVEVKQGYTGVFTKQKLVTVGHIIEPFYMVTD